MILIHYRIKRFILLIMFCLLQLFARQSAAQSTTSWKGTTSVAWATATNWTNGVPSATISAVIGDANFTGSFQPSITATANTLDLTIGDGVIFSTLSTTRTINVYGNLLIGSSGTLANNSTSTTYSIVAKGNFTNNGVYTNANTNALVKMGGTTQTLGGSSNTSFQRLTINSGSTTILSAPISVTSVLTVTGTLDPGENPNTVTLTGSSFVLSANSTLMVKSASYDLNFTIAPSSIAASAVVDYSSNTIDQTISDGFVYGILKISGGTTKSPSGNLSLTGNLLVSNGILDLSTYTATRSAVGGSITVSNGCTLIIGGTNSLPSNFSTKTFGATGTIKYSGLDQTIVAATYGNLILSSESGAVVKTMPATAMTVAGNLNITAGNGTGVTVNAVSTITVTGNFNIGVSTSFNSGALNQNIAGDFTNDGTFSNTGGTVTLSGTSKTISGSGTTSFFKLTVTGSGITASSATSFSLASNLLTSGVGTFTHSSGGAGTLTMSGTAKTIAGTGISLNNLTVTGTISTAVALTIQGDLTVSNSFISSNTLTLSGASNSISGAGTVLTLSSLNVAGVYSCSRNISISSNLTVTGALTASSGTVTFNGTTLLTGTPNLFNATINGTSLTMASNSTLSIGGTFTKSAGTFNTTANTPNTINYNANGAQTVIAVNYNNLTLATSGAKTFASGTVGIANTFSLTGTATLNASTNSATLNLIGTAPQTLTSSGATFYNLTMSNSSGVTLADNCTVSNVLSLTSGIIATGSNRIICTSTAAGAVANQSASSYINGNLRRYIANNTSTYAFPVGTATAYTLEELINNNLAGITYIDASFGAKPGTDAGLNVWENGTYYTSVNTFGVWYLTPNANPSGGTYDLKCYTNAFTGLADNSFGILSRPDASSNAAQWIKAGGTLNATNGLGRIVSDGYALRKGLTSFSQKGIGEAGQVLPIELTAFDVTKENQNAILNWTTASEMNNNHFEIESGVTDATGNLSFTKIGEVAGMGTTTSEKHYQFTDAKNNFSGIIYYRLKQVDANNEFTYSAVKSVEFAVLPFTVSDYYPNPTTDNFSFEINSATVTAITVHVVNSVGQIVMEKNFAAQQGFNNMNMNIEKLPEGLYFVEITDQNNSVIQNRKIIKN